MSRSYRHVKEYEKEILAFAKEKGIAAAPAGAFTVNDLAVMTESILDLNCKDGTPYFKKLILDRDNVKNDVWGTELPAELKAARDAAKYKKTRSYLQQRR